MARRLKIIYKACTKIAYCVFAKFNVIVKAVSRFLIHEPHNRLLKYSVHYAQYHNWQQNTLSRKQVHTIIITSWLLLTIIVIGTISQSAVALSYWTQSDWSGGVGANSSTQYATKTNLEAKNNSLSITPDNKLTNGGFETNLDSWKLTGDSSGTFATKVDYGVGSGPYDLTSGDLDGDGDLDLVVGNYTSGTFSILKNQGNGTFAPKVDYDTGTNPYGIVSGDLDGDGDLDLTVSNYGSNTVSILKNQGNGIFAPKVDYGTGTRPQVMASEDLDGDGDLDLVVGNYTSGTFSILKNQGNGTFAPKVDYATGPSTETVTAGDFDGDGDLDLVVVTGTSSNKFSTFKNQGDGTFSGKTDYATGSLPFGAVLSDFDGDDDLDLVISTRSTNSISVFRNQGDGTFSGKTDYATTGQPYKIISGDFYGNDKQSLVVASAGGGSSISIFRSQGDGTFASRVDYGTGATPYFVTSGDFNNDGSLDLAVSNNASNTISILRNLGNPYTHSTEHTHNSTHATKIVTSTTNSLFYQSATTSARPYILTAYAYSNGSPVAAADAALYVGSAAVPTTYTDMGSGWYKLTAMVTGTTTAQKYGVQVSAGKTLYLDDLSLVSYTTGSLISAIHDSTHGSAWDKLTYTTTAASTGTTELRVRSSNNSDMSGAPAFAGCPVIASDTDLTSTNCVTENERYVQYQVTLTGQNAQTPTVSEVSIGYSPYDNIAPPTNASNMSMKRSAGGTAVAAGGWTNNPYPYFEWTAGEDNSGGTGVKGYCLYLGADSSADPVTSKGLLGNSPVDTAGACPFVVSSTYLDTATAGYIATSLASSNDPYYLNIKAIDNAHNIYSGGSAQFNFKFDNTPPKNPDYITAPSQFVSSKEVTLTWPTNGGNSASDGHSGLTGLQYRIGSNGTWYGDSHSGSGDASDLLANDGSYTTVDPPDFSAITEGNNVIYFRTWDNAGNVSTAYVTTVVKYNSSAASSPQNVSASPSTSTNNSFSFSWVAPATYQGSSSNITYCYTVNTLPNANTCSWTAAGVTSLPAGSYATQPGENTFYVVARDETMAVNYATASSVSFTANTTAPGIPLNVEIADVSTKATANWRLALSWSEPGQVGVGIAYYRVSRSSNGVNFGQVTTTAGTSHVDSGLSQNEYYYKVQACDSANNCGAYSNVVSLVPTGKYTTPPELISQPSASVSTRTAAFRWTTDRQSDSRIQYGRSSGQYFPTEAASSKRTKDHTIDLDNLDAGTTYYYRARWTDEDGNVGTSGELSFTTLPAPTVKSVTVLRTTLSTAMVQFTVKNATQIKLFYGKTDSFGGVKTINTSLSESTYAVELSGLDDGTRYYFGINPIDSDDNEYQSTRVDEFTTPARPRISNVRFQPLAGEPTSTQVVTWTTNVPATSQVYYTPKDGVRSELSDSKLTVDHRVVLRGLIDDTDYSLVVQSRDADGNLAVSDAQALRTALDTRPPNISDLKVETSIRGNGEEARGQTVISWKTDEPATSQVAYDQGSGLSVLNKRTSEDTALSLEHIVIVSDLPTSRVYTVQPLSKDKAHNETAGRTKSAIIERPSDSVITIVLNALKGVFGF